MKNLSNILLEKLRISKNMKIDDIKYVIFYRRKNSDVSNVFDTLKGVALFIKYHNNLGIHFIFKCPDDLLKTFIEKWKNFNPLPDEGEDVRAWAKEHNIIEIKADEINKYLS